MIRIESLSHVYPGTRKQPARQAISDLSLDVRDGEFCILSGPNGSGKSSLFRILCGMAKPTGGTVEIGGFDLMRQADKVRGILGVVFQSPAVDKHLSVAENLGLHADLYGLKGAEREARFAEALEWTDLKDRLGDRVETLSGGLARQVELAKCLLTRPKVLLLDEPTTGLDPNSRRNFLDALHRLHAERGMTVLMTSHIFSEAEDVDRVAIMRAGRLLAFDTPDALRAEVGREMVVVQPIDPEALEPELAKLTGRQVLRHGDELRIEDVHKDDSLPLLEKILSAHRDDIRNIGIKHPTLEDAFIHFTRGAKGDAPVAETAEDELLETGT